MHGADAALCVGQGLFKELTDCVGLVERTIVDGFPRRTEYRITARGRELRPLLIELYRTGLALQVDVASPTSR